jgi:hypothetical protein
LHSARFALRSIARRIDVLDLEIAELDVQLKQLVAAAAPRTIKQFGISTTTGGDRQANGITRQRT